jgi:hypothetical protein
LQIAMYALSLVRLAASKRGPDNVPPMHRMYRISGVGTVEFRIPPVHRKVD